MSDPRTPAGTVGLPGHVVDLDRHALLDAAGGRVDLRPQALDLLCLLARHAGETVDKRRLLDEVWPGLVVTDDSLVQAVGDIRRAIGDERHQVLQTVPRRGYRLIASASAPAEETAATTVAATASPPNPDPAVQPERSPVAAAGLTAPAARPDPAHAATAAPPRSARFALWALALLVLAGTVAFWQPWRQTADPVRAVNPDRPPIAVLDFSDPAAPSEEQQMARAYAEELTGELARNADLSVIAAQSSFAAGAGGEGLSQVAQRLGVGYLVTGSLRREGEQLRLLVQLVDARDGRVVWTERQSVDAPQVYTVRDALVQRIAGTLQSTMRGNQEKQVLQRPPASLDIYGMTLRAITLKHRFTPKDNAEAQALMERAVALDPQYAPAWLYLGYTHALDFLNGYSGPRRPAMLHTGLEQIERAVALDPRLSAAYAALAVYDPFVGRHAEAVQAGRRCMALAPSDAECMMFLAYALVVAGQPPEEALVLARRSMAVNPLPPPYMSRFFGHVLWANGLAQEALAPLDACVQAAPRLVLCRGDRIVVRAETGRIDDAMADLAELQAMVGPEISINLVVNAATYDPDAKALVERRRAALSRLQAAAHATVKP